MPGAGYGLGFPCRGTPRYHHVGCRTNTANPRRRGRACPVPRRNPDAGAGDDKRRPYGQCATLAIVRRGRACPVPLRNPDAGAGDDERRPYGQCTMLAIVRRGRACPVPLRNSDAVPGDDKRRPYGQCATPVIVPSGTGSSRPETPLPSRATTSVAPTVNARCWPSSVGDGLVPSRRSEGGAH